ncbi:linker histone H1 and H5 family [Phytophthora infestans]|uniref:Linker histone H1 and H5 family n=1 Tax=Phytophthora infestans TaxID=4787 RepID=A0A833TAS5_PHYIN|nr:linker histone H1 and H5 family [Phytophthora infestans]KAI9986891.1 hypothetical protein PInf_025860 [Phytophthora infestans]
MPSAPSTKKANAGPGYYDLIKEAVFTLKERSGSSRHAIDKYVAAKKGASYSKSRLNIALKRGVESGKLVPVKGSFKLAAEEKKGAAKKPAAKPVAKKATSAKKPAAKTAKKPDAKKSTKTAKKPAAKKTSTKKTTKTAKKPTAKKVTKSTKKVTAKKPKTTKKKVVKKSAAKKTAKK